MHSKKPLPQLAAVAAALSLAMGAQGCNASHHRLTASASLLIDLADSQLSTRDAVIGDCGFMPAVTKIVYIPDQPRTLRFQVSDTPAAQGKIADVENCLRRERKVTGVHNPL